MNVQKIQKAVAALAEKVGPQAYASLDITPHRISGCVYTKGIGADNDDVAAFSVRAVGDDPAVIISELEIKWRAEKAKRHGRIIEQMALSIIHLTDEFGVCTDAALRAEYGPLVAELSEAATERANSMASKGPFSIVSVASANAA